MLISPSENLPTSALLSGSPSSAATASANGLLELPAKTSILLPCVIIKFSPNVTLCTYSTYLNSITNFQFSQGFF